jgi:heptosyltransferase-2
MSVAFLNELYRQYPDAEISVIAKKGIHELLPFFPPIKYSFIFNKEEYKGIGGVIKFGKQIRAKENFDLFFCLPDSFSSALMGFATGTKNRIGYSRGIPGITWALYRTEKRNTKSCFNASIYQEGPFSSEY